MSIRLLPRAFSRRLHAPSVSVNVEEIDKWITAPKQLILSDTIRSEHLSDLYITLPTRDGTRKAYKPPLDGMPLGYGHHLVFFHPRIPESLLRPDGTDSDFCPPEPFTRRMWAGGKVKWNSPILIGQKVTSTSTVGSVDKKGFEHGTPMLFVNQKIEYKIDGQAEAAIEEERSHVYIPSKRNNGITREVKGLPDPDFALSSTPSSTTLFRFSALTFNGHQIHLDRDYAQRSEGYPERLVHGPLTALMLLETLMYHKPDAQLRSFEYRARNPVLVNRVSTIYGAWTSEREAQLWNEDEDGIVGMTGYIHV